MIEENCKPFLILPLLISKKAVSEQGFLFPVAHNGKGQAKLPPEPSLAHWEQLENPLDKSYSGRSIL